MNTPSGLAATLYERYENPGVSEESVDLVDTFTAVNKRANLASSTLPAQEAEDNLGMVFVDRLDDDWDGYGATPLSVGAYSEARQFIRALPNSWPMPEVVPEPEGSIALEWYKSKARLLILSFNGTGRIAYAGLFSKEEPIHGKWNFAGKIPGLFHLLLNALIL